MPARRRLDGQRDRRHPAQLLGGRAQQRAQPGVGRDDPARRVQHGHAAGHHGHEVGEALGLPLRLAHVAHHADDAHRGAVGASTRSRPGRTAARRRAGAARRGRRGAACPPPSPPAVRRPACARRRRAAERRRRARRRGRAPPTCRSARTRPWPGRGSRCPSRARRSSSAAQVRSTRPSVLPGLAALDQRDDGQLAIERAEPNDADSHCVSVGSQQSSVTVRTGKICERRIPKSSASPAAPARR